MKTKIEIKLSYPGKIERIWLTFDEELGIMDCLKKTKAVIKKPRGVKIEITDWQLLNL